MIEAEITSVGILRSFSGYLTLFGFIGYRMNQTKKVK